jgi:lipopolysaccharide biosynthesis glycosyltransferase
MKNSENHAIFLAFDQGYAALGRACLNSIKRNFPNHPHIIVSYDGCDPEFLSFLRSFRDLEIISPIDIRAITGDSDDELAEILAGEWREGVEYKYFAWTERFENYDNVLYLDIDTLVLAPLDELFSKTDFFVVTDPAQGKHCRVFKLDRRADAELHKRLNEDSLPLFEDQYQMCNSGVFVVPRHLRTREHLDQLLHLRRRYRGYCKFPDQSVISMWCYLNHFAYSQRYQFNFQTFMFNSDITGYDEKNISILHFSGPYKPTTLDFSRWGQIDKPTRIRLAKLFYSHLYEDPSLHLDSSSSAETVNRAERLPT